MSFIHFLHSKTDLQHIATVLRLSRKQRALSFAEAALLVGFPKHRYEAWEQGRDMPHLTEWLQLCDRFSLDVDSCRTGLIDRGWPIHNQGATELGHFLLPPQYNSNQTTSNRWMIPIVQYLRYQVGEAAFQLFCERRSIDPDYFYLCDQLCNFQLTHDILLELVRGKALVSEVPVLAHAAFSELQSPEIRKIFRLDNSLASALLSLKKFNQYLDLAFPYQLVETLADGYYICAGAPSDIRDQFVFEPEVKKWYHQYKIDWFKNFLLFGCGIQTTTEVIPLDDKRDPDCLFRIQTA